MVSRINLRQLLIDIINFIFVFSLFNDRFLVQHFGENILRLIFLIFILFNSIRIYRNLTNRVIIRETFPVYIYLSLTLIAALMDSAAGDWSKILNNFLLLFAALTIIAYFINYDNKKLMYFIWLSMIISVIILLSNSTLSKYTFRKTGGTGDPNEFASQLLSFLFVSIFLFKQNKKLFFIIPTVIAFVYAIFSAGSLSSFLMLFVMTIFIIFRYLKLSFTKSIIGISVSTLFIVMVLLTYNQEITNFSLVKNVLNRSEKSGTALNRVNSWYAGVFMFVDKPLLGFGMNEYHVYSPKYARVYLGKDSVAPHNIYIKILAESGIIVFTSFLIFLFILMTKYFSRIISSDYFWIYLSVLTYLLMGLTLGLTYNKYLWLSFALLMNIHIVLQKENKPVKAAIKIKNEDQRLVMESK